MHFDFLLAKQNVYDVGSIIFQNCSTGPAFEGGDRFDSRVRYGALQRIKETINKSLLVRYPILMKINRCLLGGYLTLMKVMGDSTREILLKIREPLSHA